LEFGISRSWRALRLLKYISVFVRTYLELCPDRRRHLHLRPNLNLDLNLNLTLNLNLNLFLFQKSFETPFEASFDSSIGFK
jgi:hypothetical protein